MSWSPRCGQDPHDQLPPKEYRDPTSIVGSSLTWIDHDEIECVIGSDHIHVCEYPTDQTCR